MKLLSTETVLSLGDGLKTGQSRLAQVKLANIVAKAMAAAKAAGRLYAQTHTDTDIS